MTDIQPYQFDPEEPYYKMKMIPIVSKKAELSKRAVSTNWCLRELSVLPVLVTSEYLTFLLPALESGI